MNVLSLFDGMSCGRIALQRAGIHVDNYFSSEIDKHALKVADENWPCDTANRLGDVTKIDASKLPKIDLLIGGSPCQGLSFAGKQLNFEDSRSKLFFEFVRLLKECKPKYFMLENVGMKVEFQNVITQMLGVEPIKINSNLVSAQNRKRLYWTNILVSKPCDKSIYLDSIVENGICVNVERQGKLIIGSTSKASCLMARDYKGFGNQRMTGVQVENGTVRKLTPIEYERLQTVPENYTARVSNSQRYKMLGNGWTVDVIAHILKGIQPPMFEPRYYQADAKWALFDYFRQNPTGNPVVAMPTGTGKSIVIADFIREVFKNWPTQRVMMLTHVKELIEQNASKVMQVWPTAPLGIYSAGLNSRDMILPIVFGGIQSVSNAIKKSIEQPGQTPAHLLHFGWRDLVIIDECHLLSPKEDSAYQYAIGELLKINPHLRVIGLSATPYRLKQGLITDEGFFTDICYDITGVDAFNKLIAEGFICPLIPKSTATEIDISEVKMLGGDYNQSQLENAVDKDEITYAAVKEIVEKGHDRKAWIIFCTGINHVEHVTSMLQSFGIDARAVHSKKPSVENDKNIMDFKNGLARCLVNNGKLTTGFDHPPIDLIGMLRHTMSPGLWVQMLGRGTRPSPGTQKENCLVLDFAKNTPRLGPINDPVKPRKAGKGTGEAPVKICDACGAYNHAGARFCCSCNEPFSFTSKLFTTAGTDVLIKSDLPQIEFYKVDKIIYNLHEKKDKQSGQLLAPPSIKVSYFAGLRMFNEWVCLEHSGLPGKKARDWWRQRHNEEPPATTWQALQKVKELRTPAQMKVWVNKKYPEILNAEW